MKQLIVYFFKNKVEKNTQKNLSSIQLPTRLLKRFKDKYLTKILSYIIPQERT